MLGIIDSPNLPCCASVWRQTLCGLFTLTVLSGALSADDQGSARQPPLEFSRPVDSLARADGVPRVPSAAAERAPAGMAQPIALPSAVPAQSAMPEGSLRPCRVLDGRDIACRAAQQWLPSDILRQRGRSLVQLFCDEDEGQRRASLAIYHFLDMQAKHQEDIGAAAALRAYFTRIALDEQLLLTDDSLVFLEREASKQRAALDGGLPAGTDLSEFERQRLEVRDQQLQILSQDRQLRCVLSELTGIDYAMSDVCQEQLVIHPAPLDCMRLKQVALSQRQDLRGWRYLACQVNEESAPIFAQMLGTVVGGWGLPLPRIVGLKNVLCPPDTSSLAANMQHELQLTIETHRRWICQAVDEKCAKLELAYGRIALADKTVVSWQGRIAQLEMLDANGDGKPAELATARAELLRARAEATSRRLDARLAEVDLAEAVGCLSVRVCSGQAWLLTGHE